MICITSWAKKWIVCTLPEAVQLLLFQITCLIIDCTLLDTTHNYPALGFSTQPKSWANTSSKYVIPPLGWAIVKSNWEVCNKYCTVLSQDDYLFLIFLVSSMIAILFIRMLLTDFDEFDYRLCIYLSNVVKMWGKSEVATMVANFNFSFSNFSFYQTLSTEAMCRWKVSITIAEFFEITTISSLVILMVHFIEMYLQNIIQL